MIKNLSYYTSQQIYYIIIFLLMTSCATNHSNIENNQTKNTSSGYAPELKSMVKESLGFEPTGMAMRQVLGIKNNKQEAIIKLFNMTFVQCYELVSEQASLHNDMLTPFDRCCEYSINKVYGTKMYTVNEIRIALQNLLDDKYYFEQFYAKLK